MGVTISYPTTDIIDSNKEDEKFQVLTFLGNICDTYGTYDDIVDSIIDVTYYSPDKKEELENFINKQLRSLPNKIFRSINKFINKETKISKKLLKKNNKKNENQIFILRIYMDQIGQFMNRLLLNTVTINEVEVLYPTYSFNDGQILSLESICKKMDLELIWDVKLFEQQKIKFNNFILWTQKYTLYILDFNGEGVLISKEQIKGYEYHLCGPVLHPGVKSICRVCKGQIRLFWKYCYEGKTLKILLNDLYEYLFYDTGYLHEEINEIDNSKKQLYFDVDNKLNSKQPLFFDDDDGEVIRFDSLTPEKNQV